MLFAVNNVELIGNESYTDIDKDDWFAGAVGCVTDEGLLAGMGHGELGPDVTVNRAMVMTVRAQLAQIIMNFVKSLEKE